MFLIKFQFITLFYPTDFQPLSLKPVSTVKLDRGDDLTFKTFQLCRL